MTPTHLPRLARSLATTAAVAVTVLLLGACGSVPYAADAGSPGIAPTGGGAPGASGGDPGASGAVPAPATGTSQTAPDQPILTAGDGTVTGGVVGPDVPVSATDQPGAGGFRPSVTGRVTDAAGKPVAGLLVSVVSRGEPTMAIPEIGVLTGADGRYAWPALPAGTFEIQVTRDGRTASAPVTLEAGRTATADLVLR